MPVAVEFEEVVEEAGDEIAYGRSAQTAEKPEALHDGKHSSG
jgi:hypothetical protein